MRVGEVMTRDVEVIMPSDTIQLAAKLMDDLGVGALPVCDGERLVGMITDRDIVVRLIAEGKDPASAHVDDAMSKNVRSVREDAAIDEVLQVMRNAQVRRVPVVNNSNELVGIVSMADVASATRESGKVGDTVEKISEAPPNN